MGIFGNAVYNMMKRPFIVLFILLVMPVYCLVESVFLRVVFGLSAFGTGNVFKVLIQLIQLIAGLFDSPLAAIKMIFYILIASGALSILLGFLLSGYLSVLDNNMDGKPKEKGEFFAGVRKYLYSISFITFKVLVSFIAFLFILALILIPALVITQSFMEAGVGSIVPTIFLDIVTLGVVFFALMFFRLYLLFWYPAALKFDNKPFVKGKAVVDTFFWNLVGRLSVFDLVLASYSIIYIILNFRNVSGGSGTLSLILFITNWIFKSLFAASLITFVFSAFKIYSASTKE